MKSLILTLVAIFAMTSIATPATAAQKPETVTVKAGKQRSASKSKLKIKFVSVVEDSRCPENVQCVWAGNAKIKVTVTSARGSETFEMNTGMGPQGNQFDGWAINLESLTPTPRAGSKPISAKAYVAKFTITRLQR